MEVLKDPEAAAHLSPVHLSPGLGQDGRGELEAAGVTSHLCCCSCWAENSPLLGRLAQGVKSSAPRERQEPAREKN